MCNLFSFLVHFFYLISQMFIMITIWIMMQYFVLLTIIKRVLKTINTQHDQLKKKIQKFLRF